MSLPDTFHPTNQVASQVTTDTTNDAKTTQQRSRWIIATVVLLIVGMSLSLGGWALYQRQHQTTDAQVSPEIALVTEAFDTIQDNYWDELSDEQLANMFLAGVSRVYGTQPEFNPADQASLTTLLAKLQRDNPDVDHELLVAQIIDLVMMNLQPFERSRLYTKQDEEALSNRVSNIDPDTDLLAALEVDPQASDEAIVQAFEVKKEEIEQTATDEAARTAQVAELERAYEALATTELRQRYTETKVEPTIGGKQLTPDIFYLPIKQFSPTTVEDLQFTLAQAGENPGTALIIDLRGNVGGAIDGLPYFLGPFIGANQYAYQFFSQGTTKDFKTKTGWLEELVPFKRVVVLIDSRTQSSAEVMASVLKKYHVGILVGTPSAGWGTVERVFPLTTQMPSGNTYSLFLVHSLTLNEAGEEIDSNGVEPLVNVRQPNWQDQLFQYFKDRALVEQVEKLVETE